MVDNISLHSSSKPSANCWWRSLLNPIVGQWKLLRSHLHTVRSICPSIYLLVCWQPVHPELIKRRPRIIPYSVSDGGRSQRMHPVMNHPSEMPLQIISDVSRISCLRESRPTCRLWSKRNHDLRSAKLHATDRHLIGRLPVCIPAFWAENLTNEWFISVGNTSIQFFTVLFSYNVLRIR